MADVPMWPDEIYRILRDWDVTQFSYVPDAGHAVLINRSLEDPEVHSVALTTEEEGVAMLAGAHLGGARGVALMQSSGVGNCVNMFSFVKNGQFPMLILVSMRGDFGEGNPWQMPMGQTVQPILETCGFICMRVDQPAEAVGGLVELPLLDRDAPEVERGTGVSGVRLERRLEHGLSLAELPRLEQAHAVRVHVLTRHQRRDQDAGANQ